MRFRCEICNREFKDEDGLSQHNVSKHPVPVITPSLINTKKIKNWTISILVLGIIIGLLFWGMNSLIGESKECKTAPVTEVNIGSHTNLKLHIHSNLKIIIDGVEQQIPPNIGVSPGILRPVHTHDEPGKIHIEGLCAREFSLGEFFSVWGETFNSSCIFDKCGGELKFFVNGKENSEFERVILRDDQEIFIEYKSK